MEEFVTIGKAEDILAGSGFVAEVNGKSVAVFNVEGSYYAIDNTCLHRGGPLGEGELEGEVVTCPWHGWEYNVKTGACINNPSVCVKSYPVLVEGSELKVKL